MRLAILLASAALVAGCMSPGDLGAPPATTKHDLSKPFSFTYNASSCLESDVVFLVDQAKLQSQLPPGFKAADASALGGAPVPIPTGKGAVLVNAFSCDKTDRNETIVEGQIAILTEKPKMKASGPASFLDFYELARYAGDDSEGRALDALGWPHHHSEVKATMTRTGGTGDVSSGGAKVYSFSITTPAAATAQGTARFWHVLGNGTAWFDYTFEKSVDQLVGTAQCTVAAGSHVANVTGVTSCTPDNSLGLGFPSLAPKVTLTYDPLLKSE